MSFVFMALSPAPEACLSNLAALLVLNEFDNIIGYIFELRVKKKFPRLQIMDDLLKDEFTIQSQNIAEAFTSIFLLLNFVYIVSLNVFLRESCSHFEEFYSE